MSEGGENLSPQENSLRELGQKLELEMINHGFVVTTAPNAEEYHEDAYLILENDEYSYDLNSDAKEITVMKNGEAQTNLYIIAEEDTYEIPPSSGTKRILEDIEKQRLYNELKEAKPNDDAIQSDFEAFAEDVERTEGRQFWAKELPFPLPFPEFLRSNK